MSPKLKKILMISGAAAAGYIVYRKMFKSSTPSSGALVSERLASKRLDAARLQGCGTSDELGIEQDLGSLSGSTFR